MENASNLFLRIKLILIFLASDSSFGFFQTQFWLLICYSISWIRTKDYINLKINKKRRSSIDLGIHNSTVFSTVHLVKPSFRPFVSSDILTLFRLSKGFATIWVGSDISKLFSAKVCFYQTCKFVSLEENIMQKRSFLNDSFRFVFALYFHLEDRTTICMFDKSKLLQNTILNRWTLLRLRKTS